MDTQKVIDISTKVVQNSSLSISLRFRALFTLRALFILRTLLPEATIDALKSGLKDDSALLQHECVYSIGQMQAGQCIPFLQGLIEDKNQQAIVRHEAGEALGVIGAQYPEVKEFLQKYEKDEEVIVAESCQLAVQRIDYLIKTGQDNEAVRSPFGSYDPTPAHESKDIEELERILLSSSSTLFDRYRAMFALRNINTTASIESLCKGFRVPGALFRHELAFALGQTRNPVAETALFKVLDDVNQHFVTRHESAFALGFIGTPSCAKALAAHKGDPNRVVRESVEVALHVIKCPITTELKSTDPMFVGGF